MQVIEWQAHDAETLGLAMSSSLSLERRFLPSPGASHTTLEVPTLIVKCT